MIVDLIREEIVKAYGPRHMSMPKDEYNVYCSDVFLRLFTKDVLSMGFIIGELPKDYKPVKFQLPNIGILTFIQKDDIQGYKIEKDEIH